MRDVLVVSKYCVYEVALTFHGDRTHSVTDWWGHRATIASFTHRLVLSASEAQREELPSSTPHMSTMT